METYAYVLDRKLTIRSCSINWDAFAVANRGHEAMQRHVIGTNLIDWISDEETLAVYLSVIDRLTVNREEFAFAFRCDSQDEARVFRCSITKLANGYYVQNTLEAVAPFERRLDWCFSTDEGAVKKCSVCNRYQIDGQWIEQSHLANRAQDDPIPVSYGVCGDCRSRLSVPPSASALVAAR
jgi:uncharacterized protein YlaI